jgi:MOSC domain-containing protein YiiM
MGNVVSIVYTPSGIDPKPPEHYARVPLLEVVLVAGQGIEGDRKGGNRPRQLNLMSAATLNLLQAEGFQTGPGEMGEQIVLSGLPVDALQPGDRLRLGRSAVVEVVEPRTGCGRFEAIQGKLRDSVAGRLGVMAQVIEGGLLRVGDPAERPAVEENVGKG